MEVSNIKTLHECLDSIQIMEQTCHNRFSKNVCQNIKNYYRNYCYNRFEKADTCSSVNTFGGTTLNLSTKSPPPPSL